jgi:regulator of RNase E activity RraA
MSPAGDAALFDLFKRITTASLAGVMLKLGLSNQWVRGPMPLKLEYPRTVGRAFTMRFIPARDDVPGALLEKLPVNREAVEAMPAGCIAVADAGGTLDAATFGDIVVARMVKRGVAGLVTDGAVRDRNGLLATGMPIWTCGVTAPPPATRILLAAWQQPIGCGGVAVFADDIIVADSDGVVVIPAGMAARVAGKGLEQEQLDAWQMEQIGRGISLADLTPLPKTDAGVKA